MDIDVPNYVDISYTAQCYIKRSANDPDPIVECLITKIEENPGCYFRVSLTPEETLLLKTTGNSPMDPSPYVYDIIIKDTAEQIIRIVEGYAWVHPGVTL